ncbi:MAG: aldose 1-epimerase [Filimonas sp.]|nr:aldose 1-epimerase [Filimonas sp.]
MPFELIVNDRKDVIVLKDITGNCEAEIYCTGALLNAFRVQTAAGNYNVVHGFNSVEEVKEKITAGFHSAKLSPFVCRLDKGSYVLAGKSYTIEKFYLPPHAIHGIIYDETFSIASTHVDGKSASVTLQYHYSGQDSGYPFPYDISIQWTLKEKQTLSVTTTVQHANDNYIPYADGWHPYFKLDTATIDECTLQFDSFTQVQFDSTLIPTGKVLQDVRFQQAATLQGVELDNCFTLDPLTQHSGCVLTGKQLRLNIRPEKAYPYLQVYTPPHRESIAIENLSSAPDAFNNGIGLIMMEKNKSYSFTTSYIIETV